MTWSKIFQKTCELKFVSADLVALAREDARGDSQDSHSNIPGERTGVYQGGGLAHEF